jgi:hypothetical protein
MKKFLFLFIFLLTLEVTAQEKTEIASADYQNNGVEMADLMRKDGKIWVLVGIIGIVLGGLLVYVGVADKKISNLEKELKSSIKDYK